MRFRRPSPLQSIAWHVALSVVVLLVVFGNSARDVSAQASTITSVTPAQTPLGQAPAKIVLKGTGFVAGSTVLLNNTTVPAKVKPNGQKIIVRGAPGDLFQTSGAVNIRVVSPQGQESNVARLIVGSLNTIRITAPTALVVNVGNSVKISAQVVNQNGQPVPNATISFRAENPTAATVDAGGTVRGVAPGAATITLSSSDTTRAVTFAVSQIIDAVPSGIFGDGDIKVDGASGTVYATDLRNHVVRSGGIGKALADFAGRSGSSGNADGGLTDSRFNGPLGVGFGSKLLLLADTANRAIRRIDLTGGQSQTVITLADVTANSGIQNWGPRGVVQTPNGDLFITDALNHVVWRARFNGNQVTMNIFAGAAGQPGLRDELGTAARFNAPQELEIGGANTLVVSDRVNKLVRLIALPGGAVSTIGTLRNRADGDADGGDFQQSGVTLNDPTGVDFDSAGDIYVADGASVKVITVRGDETVVTDLAQAGTFQNAVGISIAGDTAFVLDAGKGQILRVGTGAPTVASITPLQIATGKQTEIILTGRNFLAESQVSVGTQNISPVSVDNSTKLRFVLPAQTLGGKLPVTVRNRGGSATITLEVVGPPGAPSNLTATPISNNQIDLKWTDNSTNENGFVVERKVGDGDFEAVNTTNPDVTTFTDTRVRAGIRYAYRVRAMSNFGESANSNEATAIPATPVKITFSPATSSAAPGGRVQVSVNLEIGADPGDQPGTVTIDIPLDPRNVALGGVTAAPGALIPTAAYPSGDLSVTAFADGIRILLTSSKDPLNAKLNSGAGTFCVLTIPIATGAPSGNQPLTVSAQSPFNTQFNKPLVAGGQVIPFTVTGGSITIAR